MTFPSHSASRPTASGTSEAGTSEAGPPATATPGSVPSTVGVAAGLPAGLAAGAGFDSRRAGSVLMAFGGLGIVLLAACLVAVIVSFVTAIGLLR